MKSTFLWKLFAVFALIAAMGLLALRFADERMTHLIILVAAFALLIASSIGFFISRSFSRSLHDIIDVADRIADGDFSRKILPKRRNELATLALTINDMGEKLQEHFDELRRQKERLQTILDGMVEGVLVTNDEARIELMNPAVCTMLGLDVTSLRKNVLECLRHRDLHDSIVRVLHEARSEEKEIELLRGNEKRTIIIQTAPLFEKNYGVSGAVSVFEDVTSFRRLENIRREFVANVSHELKTPLTSICGYAETLLSDQPSDVSSTRFLQKIYHNGLALQKLIDDLLNLARIESGRQPLLKEPIKLYEFCEELHELYVDTLRAQMITFENKISSSLILSADRAALRRILNNLFENALKHTPAEGRIMVSAFQHPKNCIVMIEDTGSGIAYESLPHIFERFYRVDKGRSRDVGGTGLGLAIVKHLMHIHGGEVAVESELGKGTRFSLTFPLS